MKKVAALFLLLLAANTAFGQQETKSVKEIRAVLDAQVAAWNQGDIEGFMKGYWNSPKTTFSGRTLTRGWQTVLDNYKKNYNTREKMGVLSFGELEITPLSKDSAYVFGTWKIDDGKTNPNGRYTLIFRKTRDGWRIIHDHTS
ncbi:MAG TPA: DUF4440 domain-containing protein [Pyrinomonadaceae bacterium]|jgi:ketosteroid isomerase-like protein|nr:DUF4440 domain-containing protein [Pyrinomonadaceae bacterium]